MSEMQPPKKCPHCPAVFEWKDYLNSASQEEKMAANAYWQLRYHIEAEHADKMITCPRQGESGRGDRPQAFWSEDGTCSFCGSFSQEQFLAAVEAGAEVGPTDKSYKAYLSGEHVPAHSGAAKFYYQHLDEAGRARFIELYNEKKMNIGFPGRFYVMPFFCSAVPPAP